MSLLGKQSMVDPARIPSGQVLTRKWPVLNFGPVPAIDLASWDIKIFGQVEHDLRFDFDEFHRLPTIERSVDFHCVTGWSRLDNAFEGVSFAEIAKLAAPLAAARFVIAHCERGFTTSLALADLVDDDVMLAFGWNGRPLTPEHGWPLRLLVPRKYGWKSAKWLRGLEFSERNRLGFWEQRGYHDEADPWRETRYW